MVEPSERFSFLVISPGSPHEGHLLAASYRDSVIVPQLILHNGNTVAQVS